MPAMVGAAAIEFSLPDADGVGRALSEFHAVGPVVLIFLPSVYGWRPRWQFWSLLRHFDDFVALGAEVVVISADPVPELRIFQIRRHLPFVFLCDAQRRVAAAYDPRLGTGAAGALIVNAAGVLVFRHIARHSRRLGASALLRRLRPLVGG